MAQTLTARFARTTIIGITLLVAASALALAQGVAPAPLAPGTARITINGNSNLHPWTASTTAATVTRGEGNRFEVSVRAAALSSPREGLDKNMHKALKAEKFPEITFRVARLDPPSVGEGAYKVTGLLTIAGVAREITLDLTAQQHEGGLAVKGGLDLLMPDFGIAPPKAMLGMLKTDPKVTILVETMLAAQ
jgi:polyisoprenoid-binding protein YceI